MACGPEAEIAEFAVRIEQVEGATIIARASDGETAFLKAHLPAVRYGDFMGLMASRPPHVEMPFVGRAFRSSEDGRIEDVGNPYAPPVIVGVIADAQVLERIKTHLPWARWQPMDIEHFGGGVFYEPVEDDREAYEAFVREAAAGYYANASVVLLRAVQIAR